MNLDIKVIIGYRKFCNKIWNSCKYSFSKFGPDFVYKESEVSFEKATFMNKWILIKFNKAVKKVNENFSGYIFGDGVSAFRSFWMNEFCDIYLELTKPVLMGSDEKEKEETKKILYKIQSIIVIRKIDSS